MEAAAPTDPADVRGCVAVAAAPRARGRAAVAREADGAADAARPTRTLPAAGRKALGSRRGQTRKSGYPARRPEAMRRAGARQRRAATARPDRESRAAAGQWRRRRRPEIRSLGRLGRLVPARRPFGHARLDIGLRHQPAGRPVRRRPAPCRPARCRPAPCRPVRCRPPGRRTPHPAASGTDRSVRRFRPGRAWPRSRTARGSKTFLQVPVGYRDGLVAARVPARRGAPAAGHRGPRTRILATVPACRRCPSPVCPDPERA